MRIGIRILLSYFLVVAVAAYFVLRIFTQEVKPGVRQGMEEALVDTSQLLAELAAQDLKAGKLQSGKFAEALERYTARESRARIWGISKTASDFRVYITDERGIVIFDSTGEALGQDYSRWNDVYRTLRGQYGARSTRKDPKDPSSSIMHVAAPVLDQGQIIGVLTVAKPSASVQPFADRSERTVLRAGLALMGVALLVGVAFSLWLSRSLWRLRNYARTVAEGGKAEVPNLGAGELAELGQALEAMREKLEGRRYIERYVHTLTHEMKGPLSAIHGAAELLEEDMPPEEHQRFLANILEHEERLQKLLERMLSLATVEHRQTLKEASPIFLGPLLDAVLREKKDKCERKALSIHVSLPPDAEVLGETQLLHLALSNLVDNALDFSPRESTISISVETIEGQVILKIQDQGPGIPDYAQEKIFEPFYSLARPNTRKKSTGLGLSFVREVAALHGGSIEVHNVPEGGAEARLALPLV